MTIPKHAMRCLECGVVIWHKDHAVGCRFYKPPVQRQMMTTPAATLIMDSLSPPMCLVIVQRGRKAKPVTAGDRLPPLMSQPEKEEG